MKTVVVIMCLLLLAGCASMPQPANETSIWNQQPTGFWESYFSNVDAFEVCGTNLAVELLLIGTGSGPLRLEMDDICDPNYLNKY